MENPLGTSLDTSREINDQVGGILRRVPGLPGIDHYLSKETVLNLLALRFANSLFVNNWDCPRSTTVEITVALEEGYRRSLRLLRSGQASTRRDPEPSAADPAHDRDSRRRPDLSYPLAVFVTKRAKVLKSLRRIDRRSNVRGEKRSAASILPSASPRVKVPATSKKGEPSQQYRDLCGYPRRYR